MKVHLNRYTEKKGHETFGAVYDLSIPGHEDEMAAGTANAMNGTKDDEIWFYTVESWSGDIWDGKTFLDVNREYSVCYTCKRDIARGGPVEDWYHVEGLVFVDHPAKPKRAERPVIIPNNEMEKLVIKYLQHLRFMGVDAHLEYHHHFNTPVNFTDEEWAKLQALNVDAVVQE